MDGYNYKPRDAKEFWELVKSAKRQGGLLPASFGRMLYTSNLRTVRRWTSVVLAIQFGKIYATSLGTSYTRKKYILTCINSVIFLVLSGFHYVPPPGKHHCVEGKEPHGLHWVPSLQLP